MVGHEFHPVKWVLNALATRHQRMRLDELDDHLLRDIGVDRVTARKESERPFWDLP
ncbi:MAG: DUF1127 domain-containing protein [Maritimibacter sp.]|nr:DUF1127 domain-containing protein [Maritimibacter sp.]